jgi:twinkle protein
MAFVKTHLPCPDCGGSDPLALNEDGSSYCFSCTTHTPAKEKVTDFKTYQRNSTLHSNDGGEFYPLTDRGIRLETAKKYGVRSVKNSRGEIVEHAYPYYINNEAVASKVRGQDKNFYWKGANKGVGLFGQQAFQSGGKYITIVEGECDAMAAYELLGSKWPVVSIVNGAQSADKCVKENLEFIESFRYCSN